MARHLPLKVYLDSCDYGHLYTDRNEWQEDLVLYLRDKIDSREVVVVFSYAIIMEILQNFSIEYKEDRLSRAEFVKNICGNNCYRFFMDCTDGSDPYNNDGDWLPSYVKDLFNIDLISCAMVSVIISLAKCGHFGQDGMKRIFDKPSGFISFVADYPEVLEAKTSYHLSPEFYEKKVVKSYVLGSMSKDEANRILLYALRDPVLFFKNYFDVGGFKNHFTMPFHKFSVAMHRCIDDLRYIVSQPRFSNDIAKNVDVSMYWKNMFNFFPPEMEWLLNAYFAENIKQPCYQKSDAADMLHGLYLPHCDLWRGDKRFSALLARRKVPFHQRIVPALSDLKKRIESSLKHRE